MTSSIEQIFKKYITLGHQNSSGWYSVLCKVCNDHGKKGNRAGVLFSNDYSCSYHCFNCGHKATYNPSVDKVLSDNMMTVLNAFNVPEEEWQKVIFSNYGKQTSSRTSTSSNANTLKEPTKVALPNFFFPLNDAPDDNKTKILATEILSRRGFDAKDYNFYIAHDIGLISKKWINRVIIPMYKDGKVTFYQGRALTDQCIKKYESPPIPQPLSRYDLLFNKDTTPLFVVEGWFDAESIGGVAVLGSTMSNEQVKWLGRSPRPKVIIPDRYGDGYLLANQAIELGWKVSTPDVGQDCKDMNDAVVKYGYLYVLNSIMENIHEGFTAKTNVSLYCSGRSS